MPREVLPFDTWIVVEHPAKGGVALISLHATQCEAEAERDKRNREARHSRFSACLLLEPVAQRMGGHRHPLCTTGHGATGDPATHNPAPGTAAPSRQIDGRRKATG
jgi:hypothetical protein